MPSAARRLQLCQALASNKNQKQQYEKQRKGRDENSRPIFCSMDGVRCLETRSNINRKSDRFSGAANTT